MLDFYKQFLDNHYLITNIVQNFPFITIVFSLLVGIFCVALKPKTAMRVCIFTFVICFVMSVATLLYCIKAGDYYTYIMGRFPAPFGNEIRVGILEALMASGFSLVITLSLIGGLRHVLHDVPEEKQNYYFLMLVLLFTSLLALIYTNDLFTAYVFVEINTLTACAIVMLKKGKTTLVATARYLMMSLLGSGLIMIGISILYDITGHLLMQNIKESVTALSLNGQYILPIEVVICLFAIGLGIKSALYPFHSWLPDAHGSSTSASSAVLSGLVLKGYIILLVKMFYRVFGLEVVHNLRVLDILFVLGILAMTMGSIKAISERDLKKMIAYSSVAQIGYIYLGIGIGNELGMAAALLQVLVHAFTKPMLFNTAGAFMDVSDGKKKFKYLAGAARKNMFAGIVFAIGALSMIGIPLFAGFSVKYYLGLSALENPSRVVLSIIALIISTVLNAIYYIPALMVLFRKTKETENVVFIPKNPDIPYIVSSVVFAIANFVFGIFAAYFIDLIIKGLSMFA